MRPVIYRSAYFSFGKMERYAPYGRYAAMAWYGGSDDGAPMRAENFVFPRYARVFTHQITSGEVLLLRLSLRCKKRGAKRRAK